MRGTTLCTKKTVDSVVTEYVWLGDMLIREQTGTNVTYYLYDENGSVIGFEYNGTPYYYLKNIQGDVVSIVDNSGVVVVNYTYNAWGEIISTTGTLASTIGAVNKLRYRSYYYDTETGFYYLQSRYYDPVVKRFISPDSTDYLTENGTFDGFNLYAYCVNNPVNYSDKNGFSPWYKHLAKTVSLIATFVGEVDLIARFWCGTKPAWKFFYVNMLSLKISVATFKVAIVTITLVTLALSIKYITKSMPQYKKWFKDLKYHSKRIVPGHKD